MIAHSTTEAEYLAVYYGRNELSWFQQLLIELDLKDIESQTTIMQDNMSTVSLIVDGNSRGRTKYFDVKLRVVHEDYLNKWYKIEYCPTDEMVADVSTKPLTEGLFLKFRSILMN